MRCNMVSPDKFIIPTHMFPMSEGTPAFLKTVDEKQNTAFIPDNCCKENRADPMNTTAEKKLH